MEIIETIEIEGQEIPLAAAITHSEVPAVMYTRILLPLDLKHNMEFCGHSQCFMELGVRFEMILN